jgi:hypothetical protein
VGVSNHDEVKSMKNFKYIACVVLIVASQPLMAMQPQMTRAEKLAKLKADAEKAKAAAASAPTTPAATVSSSSSSSSSSQTLQAPPPKPPKPQQVTQALARATTTSSSSSPMTMTAAQSSGPSQQTAPMIPGINWQNIPNTSDAVAYAIINNQVAYVHPDTLNVRLPRGLFFLRSKQNEIITTPTGKRLTPVFAIQNGVIGTTPYVYSFTVAKSNPNSGGYVYWQGNQGTDYVPGNFIDPERSMANWREGLNRTLAEQSSSSSSSNVVQQTAPTTATVNMLNRDMLFDDVMGISEDEFKSQAGVQPKTNIKPAVAAAQNVVARQQGVYPRANAVTEGRWSQVSVGTLQNGQRVQGLISKIARKQYGKGRISLLVHDNSNPRETDIRYLHERFHGAYFLIASNFNALEGGMGDYSNNLSGMNYHPVQGEEAAMATMPAAIYRRYLVEPINLLKDLTDTFDMGTNRYGSPIIVGVKRNAQLNESAFNIGLHENIIVSSGYNDNKMINRGDGKMKPASNKQLPTQGNGVLRVSHIYAAAHDLSRNEHDVHQQAIAKFVLKAVYKGTVLAAIERGARQLILTMIGASAFRNNPDWIVEAMRELEPLIAASDLDIYMVVRHQDPSVQARFLDDMQQVADDIQKLKQ